MPTQHTDVEASPSVTSSRRRFLAAIAATGTMAGVAGLAHAKGDSKADRDVDIALKATDESVWVGLKPTAIEGERNPTLRLRDGHRYTLSFRVVGTRPDNFAVLDGVGSIVNGIRTDVKYGQDATAVIEFTAAPEMAQYYSQLHPGQMRGRIEVLPDTTGAKK